MTFLSALVLGLFASGHCAAMCGGLQAALQPQGVLRSQADIQKHNVLLSLGRILTYTFFGAAFAWGSGTVLDYFDWREAFNGLRFAMGAMLIAIGVFIIFPALNIARFLEPLGKGVWQALSKRVQTDRIDSLNSLARGAVWAFIPCGLIYAVYLTAALSGSALQGGLIALGFGLGTLPAMLLSGSIWIWFKRVFHHPSATAAVGALYCAAGLFALFAPSFVDADFAQSYPGLLGAFFCIT